MISFDRAAEFYDQTRGFPPGIGAKVAAALIDFLPLTPADRVLEIGVGTGRIAVPLSVALGPNHRLTGVDISRKMMARLRANQPANIPPAALIEADATQLPFATGTFRALITVHVLHLIRNWRGLLQDMDRVRAPGGVFVNGGNDHTPESSGEQINRKFREIARTHGISAERQGLDTPQDLLVALPGTRATETIAATWVIERAPRLALQSLAERHFSSAWQIPDAIYPTLYAETEAWAKSHWPDLDQSIPETRGFKWTKIEFAP
jgi:SAM-dependent methyltransferase